MIGELRREGYCVVKQALTKEFVERASAACYAAQNAFRSEVGDDRTKRAGEQGVIRLPMKYDRLFYEFLDNRQVLEIVDNEMGPHSILHLQNAFVLPPDNSGNTFQTKFHRDFPRHLDGYRASLNVFVALSDFTVENGAIRVVPGSHQMRETPTQEYLSRYSTPVLCPAGSLVVFDSTLYHAAGQNRSHSDRLAVNHQFTPHWVKSQLDYCRALGEEVILSVGPNAQRLLGWRSRVPACLDEYYRPESERVYRGGQG